MVEQKIASEIEQSVNADELAPKNGGHGSILSNLIYNKEILDKYIGWLMDNLAIVNKLGGSEVIQRY